MPANLTPEYRAAEAAFRKARDPRERLERLREMLRVIPKHKGTDHLQGDIKRRIKELSEELDQALRVPISSRSSSKSRSRHHELASRVPLCFFAARALGR